MSKGSVIGFRTPVEIDDPLTALRGCCVALSGQDGWSTNNKLSKANAYEDVGDRTTQEPKSQSILGLEIPKSSTRSKTRLSSGRESQKDLTAT